MSAAGPFCSQCGTHMLLVRVLPDRPGYEKQTYKCSWCPEEMTQVCCINESALRLMAKKHFSRSGLEARLIAVKIANLPEILKYAK